MSGLKYALALLGAGGATALASEAAAATYVPPAPLSPYDAPVDIAIFEGGPAQFYYGAGISKFGSNAALLGTYGASTVGVDNFGFPASTQASGEVKLGTLDTNPTARSADYIFNGTGADQYVSLTFQHAGTKYAGSAHVDVGGYLQSIDYAVAGVPEPASWALMIGGFGLAGVALRTRRRQAAVSA